MTQQTLPLITFYQGWENYQHRLVTMIAPFPPHSWPGLSRPITGRSGG